MTFLSVTRNASQPLVGQTYKHRVEIFPDDTTSYNQKFDTPPSYDYNKAEGGEIYPCSKTGVNTSGVPLSKLNSAHQQPDVFNNLDETTEINLATMFVDTEPAAPAATSALLECGTSTRTMVFAHSGARQQEYWLPQGALRCRREWKRLGSF